MRDKARLVRSLAAFFRHRLFPYALIAVGTAFISFSAYLIFERVRPLGLANTRPPADVQLHVIKPLLKEIVDEFKPNQTVTEALVGHGLSLRDVYEMVESARSVYNLARVKAKEPYWLCLTPDGQIHDFRYAVDRYRYLTIYRDQENRFVPVMKPFAYETRVEMVSGIIEESLFTSMQEAGEQDRLALELADIFGCDIDFYTDIQKGDTYRLLVEKKYLNGEFRDYGVILAARITNQNKWFSGFRFEDENGKPAYYGADGKALKRSFLKSPLKFARISSRFSLARMHPILKIVRPHLGVDYAAPTGTPVQAVGAGVVTAAYQSSGGGKMVKLRHTGGFETMYMHLSKIAVRPGARVSQGEVIGYVGATGLATGPHLDFRVWQHGRPVNPVKVIFPPAPPVPSTAMVRFGTLRDRLAGRLDPVHY